MNTKSIDVYDIHFLNRDYFFLVILHIEYFLVTHLSDKPINLLKFW